MPLDSETEKKIWEAAATTSDPGRARRNLLRFLELNPGQGRLIPSLPLTAKLFAASQFLANFCIARPAELRSAVMEREKNMSARLLATRAQKELVLDEDSDLSSMMTALRLFKKRYLLRITLRDISGDSDIQSGMDELTVLAEQIISTALAWSVRLNVRKFGTPPDNAMALIALGKLGGEELNYSSDIDVIAVYRSDEGQTSGIPNPSGVVYNRISTHEFYCKTVELFARMLSSQTGDGIAYRVDLRLRPQGQKGDIALPLKAYRTYYESWGRTWERIMLIRARPVAGDAGLGQAFMDTITPFVWREALDFSEIEEIQGLKKKIDSAYDRNDIKRGYGGIREVEFFVQTFQLLFGGAQTSLRTHRILNAIQALKWLKKVPEEDLTSLWENYLFLRRLEHYLQMKEDLQTHTLPAAEELEPLAQKMGFSDQDHFLADLRLRRMQVKSMYNSLLGTREDVQSEALSLLEGGMKDSEISGYLSFRKVHEPAQALLRVKNIGEHLGVFRTPQERDLSRQVVPLMIENALASSDPDRALAGIESMITSYGIRPAHLTAFLEQRELMSGVVQIFSMSPYLSRIFLSNHFYLDMLIEEWSIAKSLRAMEDKLKRIEAAGEDVSTVLARHRRTEEVRIGMLCLVNILKFEDLFRGLSQLAEAVIRAVVEKSGYRGLSVIALGKLGGREMTFGSDLDIIFVSESAQAMSHAERIIKTLTAYTDMGMLYSVDTRLRPDGSSGALVNNIEGYRNYYTGKAQSWEIQALLKARPAGGDMALGRAFAAMARDVVIKRGPAIGGDEITAMRERIVRELSREAGGIDIKLGPGGLGEIEFYTQSLQLRHAASFPEILVQNTGAALLRLAKKDLLSADRKDTLYNTYSYLSKLQTFLRLNEAEVLPEEGALMVRAARFMGFDPPREFARYVRGLREAVTTAVSGA
ncbi:MAG: bifunctional [glutamate--ammonia ligase]-adenylyl-L-tyrosine phosphorylase/[glutamate--ammonia-ligase] adenylyltransferase [Nitrospiraceae bacterium]|nr:MAG: bifunctional [glutamate--ammonia ligase]-adenylyl-L-tyrosine phosphorylase/[glutamate--ammonia-ligase] adenylyltransferase [Nitrospiraceae bacterium]